MQLKNKSNTRLILIITGMIILVVAISLYGSYITPLSGIISMSCRFYSLCCPHLSPGSELVNTTRTGYTGLVYGSQF